MINEPGGVFQRLAERNLRRGHRLNIPTAQGILAALNGAGSALWRRLRRGHRAADARTS